MRRNMLKSWKVALVVLFAWSSVAEAGPLLGKKEPADYGRKVSQNQCQTIARRNVEPYLRNPGAAEYRWGKCQAQTMSANIFKKLPKQSGWGMEFFVNSTNKWGRYTGFTRYQILIKDGQVVRRLRQNDRGGWDTY